MRTSLLACIIVHRYYSGADSRVGTEADFLEDAARSRLLDASDPGGRSAAFDASMRSKVRGPPDARPLESLRHRSSRRAAGLLG
jgi:hypothetical protein